MADFKAFIDSFNKEVDDAIAKNTTKLEQYRSARSSAIKFEDPIDLKISDKKFTTVGELFAYVYPNEDGGIQRMGAFDLAGIILGYLSSRDASDQTKESQKILNKTWSSSIQLDNALQAKEKGAQRFINDFSSALYSEFKQKEVTISSIRSEDEFEDATLYLDVRIPYGDVRLLYAPLKESDGATSVAINAPVERPTGAASTQINESTAAERSSSQSAINPTPATASGSEPTRTTESSVVTSPPEVPKEEAAPSQININLEKSEPSSPSTSQVSQVSNSTTNQINAPSVSNSTVSSQSEVSTASTSTINPEISESKPVSEIITNTSSTESTQAFQSLFDDIEQMGKTTLSSNPFSFFQDQSIKSTLTSTNPSSQSSSSTTSSPTSNTKSSSTINANSSSNSKVSSSTEVKSKSLNVNDIFSSNENSEVEATLNELFLQGINTAPIKSTSSQKSETVSEESSEIIKGGETIKEGTFETSSEKVTLPSKEVSVTKESPSFSEKIMPNLQPSKEASPQIPLAPTSSTSESVMNKESVSMTQVSPAPVKKDESQPATQMPSSSSDLLLLERRLSRIEFLLSQPLEVKIIES